MNIRVEICRDPRTRGYDIWITNELPDGTVQLAKPVELEFSKMSDSTTYDTHTLQFRGRVADDFLKEFATALAASGFKADELKTVNQEINALKYHLEDMRKLVFNLK